MKNDKISTILAITLLSIVLAILIIGLVFMGKPFLYGLEVKNWLEEHIENAQYIQFDVSLRTDHTREYQVSIDTNNKLVKIEKVATIYLDIKDSDNDRREEYTDQIYYLKFTDDTVEYYYPKEDGAYARTIIDDADFTTALADVCFPTDLSYINTSLSQLIDYAIKYFPYGSEYMTDEDYVPDDDGFMPPMPSDAVWRHYAQLDIGTEALYEPFAILKGDDAKEVADDDIYGGFSLTDPDEAIPEDWDRLRIRIWNFELANMYFYEAWTGHTYDREYTGPQRLSIYLYDNVNDPIDIELPVIE